MTHDIDFPNPTERTSFVLAVALEQSIATRQIERREKCGVSREGRQLSYQEQ